MRTSGWMKRQPWFWPTKVFLKRIVGREIWLRAEVKVDTIKVAEWTFIGEKLDAGSVIYSLGVGDDIEFDLDLIDRFGATVYAFDPTPYANEWLADQDLPANFVFKPWAASGDDGTLRLYRRIGRRGKRETVMWTSQEVAGDSGDYIDSPAYTVHSIMRILQHEQVDLLKIDVEGAEYDIIDGLRDATLPPKQLLIEFHHRFPGISQKRTLESIELLAEIGYRIFDVSESGREVGFILSEKRGGRDVSE